MDEPKPQPILDQTPAQQVPPNPDPVTPSGNKKNKIKYLLIAVSIVIVAVAGWLVWQAVDGSDNALQNTEDTTSSLGSSDVDQIDQLDTTLPDESTEPSDPSDWTVISSNSVTLLKWGIKVSIPDELVDTIVYRLKSDASPYQGVSPSVEAFQFSTKKIVDDEACMEFFNQGNEGVLLHRFSPQTAGGGLVYDEDIIKDDLTLEEYYQGYKVNSTNYFVKERGLGDFRWYKIGDNFYTFGGHITAYISESEWDNDFSFKCKQESPDFYKPFLNTILLTSQPTE